MADRTFGQALGELIFRKRKAAGLTQVQLAEDAFESAGKTRRIFTLHARLEGVTTAREDYNQAIDFYRGALRVLESAPADNAAKACRDAISQMEAELETLNTKAG